MEWSMESNYTSLISKMTVDLKEKSKVLGNFNGLLYGYTIKDEAQYYYLIDRLPEVFESILKRVYSEDEDVKVMKKLREMLTESMYRSLVISKIINAILNVTRIIENEGKLNKYSHKYLTSELLYIITSNKEIFLEELYLDIKEGDNERIVNYLYESLLNLLD